MVTPSTGAVVLLPFPFSDLSRSKLRPAVILADAGRDDWILCQITSNPYGARELSPSPTRASARVDFVEQARRDRESFLQRTVI